MHAIELSSPDPSHLRQVSLPDPGPVCHGQALVRMRAAAFNYLDRLVATGGYPGALYPNIPVADGAGEVVAIGDGVESVRVGDRVAVHPKALMLPYSLLPSTTSTIPVRSPASCPDDTATSK